MRTAAALFLLLALFSWMYVDNLGHAGVYAFGVAGAFSLLSMHLADYFERQAIRLQQAPRAHPRPTAACDPDTKSPPSPGS
jgi:hypothetical protein